MELLIRVVHKVPSDHPSHHLLTQAGDVIAFHQDGDDWGREELRNQEWRIVRVPGLTEVEAEGLIGQEVPIGPAQQQVLRKRHLSLDLGKLKVLSPALCDRRRQQRAGSFSPEQLGQSHDCEISLEHVRAVRSVKPPMANPSHIGPLGGVLG